MSAYFEDHERPRPRELGQEMKGVRRVERQEDLGVADDPGEALDGDPGEPDQHHEPSEETAHLAGPSPLRLEEREQADEGHQDGPVFTERLVRAQHADRRRDDAVGRQEPRRRDHQVPEQRDPDDLPRVPPE
jgi:hypothetical protein